MTTKNENENIFHRLEEWRKAKAAIDLSPGAPAMLEPVERLIATGDAIIVRLNDLMAIAKSHVDLIHITLPAFHPARRQDARRDQARATGDIAITGITVRLSHGSVPIGAHMNGDSALEAVSLSWGIECAPDAVARVEIENTQK